MKPNLSNSQFGDWLECPRKEWAIQRGEWPERETTRAMLRGTYVDKALTQPEQFDAWYEQNKKQIEGKSGKYAEFKLANKMIKRVKKDPLAVDILSTKSQQRLEGEIGGVTWIGFPDLIDPESQVIVDLKTIPDFSDQWARRDGRNKKVSWYNSRNWWRMATVYRSLAQNIFGGEDWEVYVLAVSVEDPPGIRGVVLNNEAFLQQQYEEIIEYQSYIQEWKRAESADDVDACGVCDYCRSTTPLAIQIGMPE